jgi:curved DNA binding protein
VRRGARVRALASDSVRARVGRGAQCAKQFKSKKLEKGVAFPTCVSSGDLVCHLSPVSAAESSKLVGGQLCRVDLGVHFDGFCAVVADTVVVVGGGDGAAAAAAAAAGGAQADVVAAAHAAAEVALRLIKPGNTNTQVTAAISAIAEAFDVTPLQGVLTHQLKQFVIDGNKIVLQREDAEAKQDEVTFEMYESYAVDICFTTNKTGKPTESGARTTVFKRLVDEHYRLKLKSSRWLLNTVSEQFATFPFTLRALGDEKQARAGVVECTTHNLLHTYPVLEDKGAQVAHFKFTVLLLPGGTLKLTGCPAPAVAAASTKKLSPEHQAIHDTASYVSKAKKKE